MRGRGREEDEAFVITLTRTGRSAIPHRRKRGRGRAHAVLYLQDKRSALERISFEDGTSEFEQTAPGAPEVVFRDSIIPNESQ